MKSGHRALLPMIAHAPRIDSQRVTLAVTGALRSDFWRSAPAPPRFRASGRIVWFQQQARCCPSGSSRGNPERFYSDIILLCNIIVNPGLALALRSRNRRPGEPQCAIHTTSNIISWRKHGNFLCDKPTERTRETIHLRSGLPAGMPDDYRFANVTHGFPSISPRM